ncbi:hypothetical protein [Thiocapsa marina]|uniref:Uncharacterized protein n=1 Tax=Thiocapsa marina 5811 TaxID=768671 RepID=F9U9J9_9GAMM|nr:hypothetical protein [Thiocapsa marina]EGV18797.1 hypothetical protein ThimaDRAFT_1601 [Thiocapsa marina 5811]
MDFWFEHLFSIECRHDFYGDGPCRAIEMRPTPECDALLQRFGCIFRPTAEGGAVYFDFRRADPGSITYNGSTRGEALLGAFDGVRPFSFIVVNREPSFDAFTKVPQRTHDRSQQLRLFDNRQLRDGGEFLLLHETGALGRSLPLKRPAFRHEFEDEQTATKWRVGPLGATCEEAEAEADAPGEPYREVTMDLSGLSPGAYQLMLCKDDFSTLETVEFYLDRAFAKPNWGIIEIFLRSPGAAEGAECIDASGKITSRRFGLRLPAREAVLKCYVAPEDADKNLTGFRIKDKVKNGTKVIEFSDPEEKPTGEPPFTGKRAWVFQTSVAVPLTERMRRGHELTLVDDGDNAALRIRFPSPRSAKPQSDRPGDPFVAAVLIDLPDKEK